MDVKREREYLTAISIESGIITLLDKDGNIVCYRQRGIQRISDEQQRLLIAMGILRRSWSVYPELPKHISISYEDPSILGIARESYPCEIIDAIKVTPKIRKKYLEDK